MPRGRPTQGDKIRDLRERKGWQRVDLAKAAGVKPKTIRRMENGGPCMVFYVSCVARVFGLQCGDLFAKQETSASATSLPDPDRRLVFQLRFAVGAKDLEAAYAYVKNGEAKFGAKHRVKLKDVDLGSIIATYEMAYEDLIRLVFRFCHGDFESFKLKTITLLDIETSELKMAIRLVRALFLSEEFHRRKRLDLKPLREILNSHAALHLPNQGFTTFKEPLVDDYPLNIRAIIEWLNYLNKRGFSDIWADMNEGVGFPNTALTRSTEGSVTIRRTQRRSSPVGSA
jgi:DNA-binding XRE family transcriptional regulator